MKVVLRVLLGVIVLVAIAIFVVATSKSPCEKYRDTAISEVPAGCVPYLWETSK